MSEQKAEPSEAGKAFRDEYMRQRWERGMEMLNGKVVDMSMANDIAPPVRRPRREAGSGGEGAVRQDRAQGLRGLRPRTVLLLRRGRRDCNGHPGVEVGQMSKTIKFSRSAQESFRRCRREVV